MLGLLEQMLLSIPGIEVCGRAKNLWEARLQISRNRPDLILLDEVLPGESIVDFIEEYKAEGLLIMLMTGVQSPTHALPPGVFGRLIKPDWNSLKKSLPGWTEALKKAMKR